MTDSIHRQHGAGDPDATIRAIILEHAGQVVAACPQCGGAAAVDGLEIAQPRPRLVARCRDCSADVDVPEDVRNRWLGAPTLPGFDG
jgi:hypothetical protein